MSKPKAYSYTRMSTLEQLKGDSRRRQFALTQRYALENGLEIVDRFDDWGVSAFRGRNAALGALNEFKARVESGEIARGSYLIVESMDRLSRDKVINALSLLTDIVSKGIILVTLDDNQVYSEQTIGNESYRLIVALASMSRAHEESRRKSNLLGEAWGEKKRLARQDGVVATRKVPGWLSVSDDGRKVEEIPCRAEVVREIFTLSRDGYGAYSICRRLNERGEPVWSTRKHAVWRESYIKKMLKSRTVLGEYQPHRIIHQESGERQRTPDGSAIAGYYPAVVSNELFIEANAAVDKRRIVGRGRKGASYANLFSGLLRCSCGAGYRYIDKGDPPKGGRYLQCSVAHQKGGCKVKAVQYDFVEFILLSFIESLDVERVLGGERRSKRLTERRSLLGDLIAKRDESEAKLRRIVEAITSGQGLASKILVIELDRLEREHENLIAEIDEVEREIGDLIQIDPEKRRLVIDELLAKLRAKDAPEVALTRRALVGELQRMLKKVVIKPNVRVAWEVADADASWMETYKVRSMAGLEKLCRELAFELVLVYQNGDTVVVDAMEGPYFKSKGRLKVKDWSYLNDAR